MTESYPANWAMFGCAAVENDAAPVETTRAAKSHTPARRLELIADLVSPEALEPNQRLIQRLKIVDADAAHLLQRLELPLIKPVHHIGHLLPFLGEPHPHRPPVGGRALMVDVAGIDQLLEIVRDVGAEIEAAARELAGRQFGIADVEQQQSLHAVDVRAAQAFKFIFDDINKQSMKPLDKLQGNKIAPLEIFYLRRARIRPLFQDYTHRLPSLVVVKSPTWRGL